MSLSSLLAGKEANFLEKNSFEKYSPFWSFFQTDVGGFLITKDSELIAGVSVKGLLLNRTNDARIKVYTEQKDRFISAIPPDVTFEYYLKKKSIEVEPLNTNNKSVYDDITNRWQSNHTSDVRVEHYFIFIMKKNKRSWDKAAAILDELIFNFSSIFNPFTPERMQINELLNHFASRFSLSEKSGQFRDKDITPEKNIDCNASAIFDAEINFTGQNVEHQSTISNALRFSSVLTVTGLPRPTFTNAIITDLLSLPINFIFHATNNIHGLHESRRRLNRMKSDYQQLSKSNTMTQSVYQAISKLCDQVEEGTQGLVDTRMSFLIYADSQELLEDSLIKASATLQHYGFQFKRTPALTRASILDYMPKSGNNHLRRAMSASVTNISDILLLPANLAGNKSSSFGKGSLAQFFLPHGQIYNFNFHPTEGELVAGHTLAIGGTGMGKTMLVLFAIANFLAKYPTGKVFAFDYNRGLEIFTKRIGGSYQMLPYCDMNPFLIESTNREQITMLTQFLISILEASNQEIKPAIVEMVNKAAKDVLALDHELRTFDQFVSFLSSYGAEDSVQSAYSSYLSDGATPYFSAKTDSLSFDNRMTVFDMTNILSQSDSEGTAGQVANTIIRHIINKLTYEISKKQLGNPFIIFLDETPTFLRDPLFEKYLKLLCEQIRKINGVFVGAGQSVSKLQGNDFTKGVIKTYLLMKDPDIDMKFFAENDDGSTFVPAQAFHQLFSMKKRAFLLAQKGGDIAVLNCDFSSLDDEIFSITSDLSLSKAIDSIDPTNNIQWQELIDSRK